MRKILLGNELLVIFAWIGDVTFGIDIRNVVSVLEPKGVRGVPFAPKYINSIMSCHGEIVTLFDIKNYFKYEDFVPAAEKKVIYLKHPQMHTGILVDKIINIDYVLLSCVESIPDSAVAAVEAEFSQGLFVLQEDAPGIYWLDTKKIELFVDNLHFSDK